MWRAYSVAYPTRAIKTDFVIKLHFVKLLQLIVRGIVGIAELDEQLFIVRSNFLDPADPFCNNFVF